MVDRYVSAPIELAPALASGDYARADLIFGDVDHSLASYEGRIYINPPDAGVDTGRDHSAYAGSFHIFGHGGCFGDAGHCDVPTEPRDPFDLRGPHQLSPATKAVIVTDALKRIVSDSPDKHGHRRGGGAGAPGQRVPALPAAAPGRLSLIPGRSAVRVVWLNRRGGSAREPIPAEGSGATIRWQVC
jgi:hypothetical protein